LSLSTTKGGLGIIDPKTQSEALLAKLLIRGFALRSKPWKELLKHRVDQIRLPVNGKGPNTQDINWLFTAPKLKTLPCSIWKSIIGAWINVRLSMSKLEPTNKAELLRQPIFRNPFITNHESKPIGLNSKNDGNAFTSSGCSMVRDLWDPEEQDWKGLLAFKMNFHPSNK
jgi:hypothetical protein